MTNAQIRSQIFCWRKRIYKSTGASSYAFDKLNRLVSLFFLDSTSTKERNNQSNSPQLELLRPS